MAADRPPARHRRLRAVRRHLRGSAAAGEASADGVAPIVVPYAATHLHQAEAFASVLPLRLNGLTPEGVFDPDTSALSAAVRAAAPCLSLPLPPLRSPLAPCSSPLSPHLPRAG